MLDISKIFSLFSGNEELDGSPIDVTSYNDFTSTPVYWVGMFRKLITNCGNFSQKFLGNIPPSEGWDMEEMEAAYKMMAYTRAFSYISNLNLEDSDHIEALERFNNDKLRNSINLSLLYFESLEEYEKCLHLKKILDFCKSSCKKT